MKEIKQKVLEELKDKYGFSKEAKDILIIEAITLTENLTTKDMIEKVEGMKPETDFVSEFNPYEVIRKDKILKKLKQSR